MGIDFGSIDWGGLLQAGLNAYGSHQNANSNQQAANTYAQQTKFNPYNINAGNSGVMFNGNNAIGSLSPQYKGIQGQLTSGASGLFGGLGQQYQQGGINPFLQGNLDQYNQGGPQNSQDLSGQFNASAQGFLGGLGSFDPNQAAQSYTNNLRAQAQPGQQRAAQGLAQGLFNGGRLGTTGGQGLFGELVNQQNQQDLGFQLAGQQYGGAEQSRLAGLAGQQAQLGSQFGQQQYDQTNARAQSRFQNAMSTFGAGQQNLQGQLTGGLGMLQGSQGLDNDLLKAIQTGGYLGGASSAANQGAYNQSYQANVAGNNASSAGWMGLAQSLGLPDMLSGGLGNLFGGGGGATGGISSGLTGGTPGMPDTGGMNDADLNKWLGIPDQVTGGMRGFDGAGGQATGSFNFPGLTPNTADSAASIGDNASLGGKSGGLGGLVSGASNALNLYSGIKQGGVAGYGQALGAGANLAQGAGLISGTTGNALGLAGNAAAGNVSGAIQSANALRSGGSAASGASAGTGLGGALTAAVPAFLLANLVSGFIGSKADPKAAANRNAYGTSSNVASGLNSYLGTNGTPKLAGVEGTGENMTRTLADGTQLNNNQWNQLMAIYSNYNNPYSKTKTSDSDIKSYLNSIPKSNVDTSTMPDWKKKYLGL